ncbi:hypothetical protein MKW94_018881 [Papaver nudicaule]|uniref:Uncharacterized protein n=1 Tax=Papaver nudicaule TaxID=74823 RepID=A0AA41SCI4_PAPNU|nr:hypothetical protein [Papaver nudicaule]
MHFYCSFIWRNFHLLFISHYRCAFLILIPAIVFVLIFHLLYLKDKYWEEHPGEAVPLMQPKFYYGPWKVHREDHMAK